ncbi:PREDICTED: probable disease resistance protein At4g19060 [Nelumbo nucifera]|uniref:NB-ARC domain-containing protein n=2 Tax=Nelumbo nucifera TaxID=4432 RepID=A0A822XKC3_NELNU|nr:PREDICTED: probable disease resistance protein At4g19060 [Nelumbo nucifera]DAD20747.1 TPA_asm: hypothetical protein HUJ06_022210 [Nelumbo nucifera]
MADVIAQFLRAKFLESLEEHGQTRFALHSQLEQLKSLLPSRSLSADEQANFINILYDLNEALTECRMLWNNHRYYHSLKAILLVHETKRRLADIKKRLKGLNGGAISSSRSDDQNQARRLSDCSWSIDTSKVHGFDENFRQLKNLLLQEGSDDGGFKAVGIVGMCGIGKSTLARLIFNSEEVKKNFCPRLWICVSGRSPKEIVERMLVDLGVEDEIIKSIINSNDLHGLLFSLYLQLVGKKYLVVFDGVWGIDEWYEQLQLNSGLPDQDDKWGEHLRNGLPKQSGGRVVVTGRLKDAVKRMVGEENLLCLSTLDKQFCNSIFTDSAEEYADDLILVNMKAEVAEKSAGLPLAAKMMGQIMKNIRKNEMGIQTQ